MNSKKNKEGGLVYSTNPDFKPEEISEEFESVSPSQQQLRVFLDRLGGNKMVSRVNGLIAPTEKIDALGKLLKQKCGVGGSVKNGEILIQGDHREKIVAILSKEGYKVKKAGG
jgi:translation initiation factor 1